MPAVPELRELAGIAVFLAALALVIARPRGLNEAWPAAGGAAILFGLGLVTLRDLAGVARETGGVLLFLAGMMVASAVAEQAGVFSWAAAAAARASRSGPGLLVNIFVLGAAVTALFSLDVTVIILTPIVYGTVVALDLDPLPYLYACTFVANTGSLIFPMSNLTNLLAVDRLQLPFWRFAAAMALPNAAAVAVNIGVFLRLFRDRLPAALTRSAPSAGRAAEEVERGPLFRTAAPLLGLVLAGLFGAGLAERPLWPVTILGGAALLAAARAHGIRAAPLVRRGVSGPLFIFVLGMAVIVRAVEHTGVLGVLARAVTRHPAGSLASLGAAAGIAAAGANLFNNIPMTLVMLGVIAPAGPHRAMALAAAALIGVNIGPALTTAGSLATIIWLSLVRRQGLDIPALEYLRVAAVTVPLALAAAFAALVLEGGLR
jgi:arsenical pump membrane protein